MPGKVSGGQEILQQNLFQNGNAAGHKSGTLTVKRNETCWQDHKACADGGCDGSGKSVYIDDPLHFTEGEECVLCLGGRAEFGVVVVFNDKSFFFHGPADVFLSFGSTGCHQGREAVKWRDMEYGSFGVPQCCTANAV